MSSIPTRLNLALALLVSTSSTFLCCTANLGPLEMSPSLADHFIPPMPGLWRPLFNGRDFTGWRVKVAGLPRGQDPQRLFQVKHGTIHAYADAPDGAEMPFGYLISEQTYGDMDIRFEYRWIGKTFGPRVGLPRDAGLLYRVVDEDAPVDALWPTSIECQVQESDTGDIWLVGTAAAVPQDGNLLAESGALVTIGAPDTFTRVPRDRQADRGGWNQVEVRVRGNRTGIHIVNGVLVNRWENLRKWSGQWLPLEAGALLFQAEGAEVQYRNVELRDGLMGPDGWLVHDRSRPLPPYQVPVPENILQESALPSPGSVVLFNGTGLGAWQQSDGTPPHWNTGPDYFSVLPGSGDLMSLGAFGSALLHLEFSEPLPPEGVDQSRGNSGVFLMSRYEIQILDNYGNPTYADGMVGAVYGQNPPLANVLRAPGEWNYYDIAFIRPVFDASGKVQRPARFTVTLNGVLVQDAFDVWGSTAFGRVATYDSHPDSMPLLLQDHGSAVRFRNIWLVESND